MKTMRYYLLLTLSVLAAHALHAGGIKGYVRDALTGEPLEFATIYIAELGSGTTTNGEGYYEYRMLPGDYRVAFQYLGYETLVERVSIGESMKDLNIRLQAQTLQLETVEIISGDEDPAYTVMRKAIAKADFHRQQVDAYQARVYVKGSGRLLKAPGMFRKAMEKEGVKADSTTAFTSESVSLIEYQRPATFKERVISVYSSGDDSGSSPNGYIYGSFYEPQVAQAISPLSTKAFGYYKFELAGYFNDRGYNVNKIKVTPRGRGDDVFSGYIYIVEDLWSIHSLQLDVYKMGIHFDIRQLYAPIQEQVWLPVSHNIAVTGKVFGFGFDYKYLATVSDYKVTVNPNLQYDIKLVDEKIQREMVAAGVAKPTPAPKKRNDRSAIEEKLEAGEELTRKDLKVLMRDYEKEERQAEETPEVVANYTQEVDTLAARRDSSYWAEVRPVPLTQAEVRGYVVQDSMRIADIQAQEDEANGIKKSNKNKSSKYSPMDVFTGTQFKLSEGQYIHYDGLTNGGFNPVEGYWLASKVRYTLNREERRLELALTPRYGFAWDRLVWKSDAAYRFGEEHSPHRIQLDGGRYVAQYNAPRNVSEIFNTLYALLGNRNYVQEYEKVFVGAQWNKEWRQTAKLSIQSEWAERRTLDNAVSKGWAKEPTSFAPNVPFIAERVGEAAPATETAATAAVSVEVNPWQKYRIRNAVRSAIDGSSPTFTLDYRVGVPDIGGSQTDFHQLGLIYRHTIRPGVRGKIDLKVDMGAFLTDGYVGLADMRHFDGNRMIFTTADPVGAFRLLPYYAYSTADKWLAAHVHYQFRKFLLTRIWEVQMTGARENVFVNYLNTPESAHYTEVGYSIDNIFRFFRLEGIAAFRDGQYHDWGIRIGVASNILGGFGEN